MGVSVKARDIKILCMRYGVDIRRGSVNRTEPPVPMTYQAIGEEVSLTASRIRSIVDQVERRLSMTVVRGGSLEIHIPPVERPASNHIKASDSRLDTPLTSLPFNRRLFSAFHSGCPAHPERLVYIGDLVILTEEEILGWRNVGRKCLRQIKGVLAGMDLGLDTKIHGAWHPDPTRGRDTCQESL
jgi:hypothetical protein